MKQWWNVIDGLLRGDSNIVPPESGLMLQAPNVGPAFRLRMLSVSAGGSHSLTICENGELWACGRGRHGQLGFGNFEDATTLRPIAALRCDAAPRRDCKP